MPERAFTSAVIAIGDYVAGRFGVMRQKRMLTVAILRGSSLGLSNNHAASIIKLEPLDYEENVMRK